MNTVYADKIKRFLPSPVYKFLAKRYIDRQYPRHLFIETTATCNLSCSYCPREKIKAEMDFELFKDIIREASKYGKRSFSLHLFGEPLLYSKWREAIDFIKRENPAHTVLLTTNGTLLEVGDVLDRLLSSGVDQVLWSWRKEVKFKEETKKRLKKWGKFRVRIIKELTPPEALEEWKTWPNQEERNLHNYGGEIDLERFGKKNEDSSKRWPCYHLWLAPAVAWNGKVLICCTDPHQKEVIGERNVHEAWIGKKLAEIRQSHIDGKFLGICKDCDVWKSTPNIF